MLVRRAVLLLRHRRRSRPWP